MARNLSPLNMSLDALIAAKEEFNPRNVKDDEVLAAVCDEIYRMPPERFREYLINRATRGEDE